MGIICCINVEKRKILCSEEKDRKSRKTSEESEKTSNIDNGNKPQTGDITNNSDNSFKIDKPPKIQVNYNIQNAKLKEFLNQIIIQDSFFETSDYIFKELKVYEIDNLTKVIEIEKGKLEEDINSMFRFNRIKESYIDDIIKKESTNSMIKKKIIHFAKEFEKDKAKYKIEHLNIILVGRKKIGKTDLIHYIFESKENVKKIKRGDLEEYSCEKVPYLKLIEYKGIGFDKDSKPDVIGENIKAYINNLQRQNNEYTNYIHCIWYCISGSKFEVSEIKLLNYLKNSYGGDKKLLLLSYILEQKMKIWPIQWSSILRIKKLIHYLLKQWLNPLKWLMEK